MGLRTDMYAGNWNAQFFYRRFPLIIFFKVSQEINIKKPVVSKSFSPQPEESLFGNRSLAITNGTARLSTVIWPRRLETRTPKITTMNLFTESYKTIYKHVLYSLLTSDIQTNFATGNSASYI